MPRAGTYSAAVLILAAPSLCRAQACELRWTSLGDGLGSNNYWLAALQVFDDGTGPALYAGGSFTMETGAPANGIARWNGAAWSSVGGGGTDGGPSKGVTDLAVFDDGAGPALYVVGWFTSIAGVSAYHAAKWDGSAWSEVGGGIHSLSPNAVAQFDDGTGPALYAAGWLAYSSLAVKLTGEGWVPVGTLTGWADRFGCEYLAIVRDLKVFDDGTGPALYAGGTFDYEDIYGLRYQNVARWDGVAWGPVGEYGPGVDCVWALEAFDDGAGFALFAGGYGGIQRWNGAEWSDVSGTSNRFVWDLLAHDDGDGPFLYVGGDFAEIGGRQANGIARWDGTDWTALHTGVMQDAEPGTVKAISAGWDDPSTIFALGEFTQAGGSPANGIARWGCTPCLADCDLSGSLDLLDFLCFSALLEAQDPAADCDASLSLDLFDFLCFTNAFNAGC